MELNDLVHRYAYTLTDALIFEACMLFFLPPILRWMEKIRRLSLEDERFPVTHMDNVTALISVLLVG